MYTIHQNYVHAQISMKTKLITIVTAHLHIVLWNHTISPAILVKIVYILSFTMNKKQNIVQRLKYVLNVYTCKYINSVFLVYKSILLIYKTDRISTVELAIVKFLTFMISNRYLKDSEYYYDSRTKIWIHILNLPFLTEKLSTSIYHL